MNIKPGKILIIDDDRMQRMLLTRTLTQQGHTVLAVENGLQALEALEGAPDGGFDIVLCDVTMPEMDGFQVLERIMADPELRKIPVIMVSGFGEMAGIVTCIEMGAADYIHKPADPALLRARVESCLSKKRWLEQELALREELQQRYQQLQELEELRDSLTHMIVHDLRTPLTSFLTGLQTVELLGTLNQDQDECLGMAIDGGQMLLGMINDLLDISKMESGALVLEKQKITAADLGQRSLQNVAGLAKDRNVQLSMEIPEDIPTVEGDADKLGRTLVNLIGNAVKFTPQGGFVTLSMAYETRPERKNSLLVSVSDNGEGIPPEAFEHIFEKFGQVEGRQAGRRLSTGLGLTFCKMVIEAHGGRIWLESELGKGATSASPFPQELCEQYL